MKELKLSVIVPVYNVERYLERCILSILNQDIPHEEYEIIMINDGSTDNSYEIATQLEKKYNNIRLFTQENKGPSAARNYGINLAKGKYIWFIDSDDYIVAGCLKKLFHIISGKELDILFFRSNIIKLDGSSIIGHHQPVPKNVILDGKKAINEGYYPCSACVEFWNKEYLDRINLRFNTEIMYAEDSLFSFSALCQSNKAYFIDDIIYIYEKREGSSTTKIGEEKIIKQNLSDIVVIKSIERLSEKYRDSDPELSNLIKKHSQKILFGLVYTLYRNRKRWGNINKTIIAKLREENLYPLKGPFYTLKKWVMSVFFNRIKMFS